LGSFDPFFILSRSRPLHPSVRAQAMFSKAFLAFRPKQSPSEGDLLMG